MSLTEAFGLTLAHLDCPPENVQTAVDFTASAKTYEQSQKLQGLLLDPNLLRIYHLDFGIAGQMRALHIATCRAREVAGRRFSQKPDQQNPLAPLLIIISDDFTGVQFEAAGIDSKVAFQLAVTLVREHLQLEEPPIVHCTQRAAHFRTLDLWLVLGPSNPHDQGDVCSASVTLSTLLGDLSSTTGSSSGVRLVWQDYSDVEVAPHLLLRLQEQAKQPRCEALISVKDPLKATPSWRALCNTLHMENVPILTAHASFSRLAGLSLADMPSWSHVLDLDSLDPNLLSLHRLWMRQAMATCLVKLLQALRDGPRAVTASLHAEICHFFQTHKVEGPAALWSYTRPSDGRLLEQQMPAPSESLLEDAKFIAGVCWCPLNGSLGPISTAFLDEYSAAPNSDTLFIPADIGEGDGKSIKPWLLARISVRLLSSHFSEVFRWQTCRPRILTGPLRESADERPTQKALVNQEMAVMWDAFSRIMRKLLNDMLEAILSLGDIDEQASWLGVAAQFEEANSHLAHGPMTLKAERVLKDSKTE